MEKRVLNPSKERPVQPGRIEGISGKRDAYYVSRVGQIPAEAQHEDRGRKKEV
jgi:hypothetical protein